MKAIQLLSVQPWVERLGATLLHFLWQGVLIATMYSAARRGTAGSRPRVRYLLACAALAIMAVAPALTWIVLRPPAREDVAMTFTAPISAAPSPAVRLAPASYPAGVYRAVPAPFLPCVV